MIAAKETAAIATRRRACRLSGITATSEPKLIRTPPAGEGGYVSPPDGAARLDPGTPLVASAVEGARCLRGRGAARRAHARPRLRHGRLEPDGRGGGTGVRSDVAPRARQHRSGRGARRRRHGTAAGSVLSDRKSTRLNSSHDQISYAVFCLKKKKKQSSRAYSENRSSSRNQQSHYQSDQRR